MSNNNNTQPQYTTGSSPLSTSQIKAHGDVQTKMAVIKGVFVICGLLTVCASIYSFIYPDKLKDIWVIVSPIISGGVFGMIGFLTGERNPKN